MKSIENIVSSNDDVSIVYQDMIDNMEDFANLLTNTKKFIYYMNILSRGQFLTSPCKGKEFY